MCMLRHECSLNMLHSVRLGGLGMPNILCMSFYFKPRGVKKYLHRSISTLGQSPPPISKMQCN